MTLVGSRRSVIGPFWLTISTAVMVSAMGFLYARIFGQDVSTYLPYLAVGLVIWGTISTMANESCTVFTTVEQIIKQVRLPLTTHVCRMVWRNAIIFGHNALILVRSEEHTSELQSRLHLVCRLLLEKKKKNKSKPE